MRLVCSVARCAGEQGKALCPGTTSAPGTSRVVPRHVMDKTHKNMDMVVHKLFTHKLMHIHTNTHILIQIFVRSPYRVPGGHLCHEVMSLLIEENCSFKGRLHVLSTTPCGMMRVLKAAGPNSILVHARCKEHVGWCIAHDAALWPNQCSCSV